MATLVEAAAQVFSREGMAATTNRIAERAGLSIGTLYQYFPDKGALLHAVAARHVLHSDARLTALFERLRATAPPFEDTMDQVLRELVDLHADHPRLHALLHRVAMTAADLEEMRIFEDRICAEVAYHLKRCDRGTEEGPGADRAQHRGAGRRAAAPGDAGPRLRHRAVTAHRRASCSSTSRSTCRPASSSWVRPGSSIG